MKEIPAFKSVIRGNSLELSRKVSTLINTRVRACYPLILFSDTLISLLNLRHINDEKLLDCHERFRQEKNLDKSQMGKHILDVFIENTVGYQQDPDTEKRKY